MLFLAVAFYQYHEAFRIRVKLLAGAKAAPLPPPVGSDTWAIVRGGGGRHRCALRRLLVPLPRAPLLLPSGGGTPARSSRRRRRRAPGSCGGLCPGCYGTAERGATRPRLPCSMARRRSRSPTSTARGSRPSCPGRMSWLHRSPSHCQSSRGQRCPDMDTPTFPSPTWKNQVNSGLCLSDLVIVCYWNLSQERERELVVQI